MTEQTPIIWPIGPRAGILMVLYFTSLLMIAFSVQAMVPLIVSMILLLFSGFIANGLKRLYLLYRETFVYRSCVIRVLMEFDKECCICLDFMQANTYAVKLGCNHYFHDHCIFEWYRLSNTCPLCRVDFHASPKPQRSSSTELSEVSVL